MHLSNAVLDRSSPDFGDHHISIGRPGFLTLEKIAQLFSQADKCDLFGRTKPSIAVEVRTLDGADPWENIAQCQKILNDAWKLAKL